LHAKASRTGNCKRLNLNDTFVGIIEIRGNSTYSPLNFPFKIVASMILFIIFFTGHFFTGHLVTDHLVTWSLGDKPFWACILQHCKISLQSAQGTADHLVTGHLVTWSLTHLENFPFKIVASMVLFIIFFTGHFVTWLLVTWSLSHLVTWSLSYMMINLFERAHYNYAKFHYNHHRAHLITWSLVTWSLTHLENFPFKIVASMKLFIIFSTGHLVTDHLVT
jgi:nicotinamide riboside transporter PnuC